LIPGFDGALFTVSWKEALWAVDALAFRPALHRKANHVIDTALRIVGGQRADVGVDHSHLGFTPASRRRRRRGALHWKRHSVNCA
jgi:hypothetical protein